MTQGNATGVRAIIFDFGGVLIDWNARYLYRKLFADESAMERFFQEVGFGDWNVEQDKGRTFAEGVAEHSKKFPQYADLIRAYDERWRESVGGEFAGTVAILRELKRAGYLLYGLSNWANEKFLLVRAQYEFFDWFDEILISSEVKLAKPDPRIYAVMLERIGQPAERCLFIDDSLKNVEAARAMGFQTILYTSPEALAEALAELGVLGSAA